MSEFYYSQAAGNNEYDVSFNAGHAIYRGHFPGNPVTPGACLMDIAAALLEQSIGAKVRITSFNMIKFLAPVMPDTQCRYKINHTADGKAEITVTDTATNTTTYAKMSVTYMRTDTDV